MERKGREEDLKTLRARGAAAEDAQKVSTHGRVFGEQLSPQRSQRRQREPAKDAKGRKPAKDLKQADPWITLELGGGS